MIENSGPNLPTSKQQDSALSKKVADLEEEIISLKENKPYLTPGMMASGGIKAP
jgi:hypothetical protein